MKKIFSILALAALCLFAACDKIDPDNYTHFAGAAGTWYDDAQGVAEPVQRVLLEKYTGIKCPNCPDADVAITAALEKYGESLIAVAIHDSADLMFGGTINGFSLGTGVGFFWRQKFVGSDCDLPRGMVMRDGSGFTPTSGIDAKVDAVLAQSPRVALSVESDRQGSQATINVHLEFLQSCPDDLILTLFLMEDGIIGPQKHGTQLVNDYPHNHVLRAAVTSMWGIDVEADGQAGTSRFVQLSYQAKNPAWNLDNCKLVALVSKKSDLSVLNVAECAF